MTETFAMPFTGQQVTVGDGALDLVGAREIEVRHGLTRGQVHRLFHAGDLPEPVAVLHLGRVYDGPAVARRIEELRLSGRINREGELRAQRRIEQGAG